MPSDESGLYERFIDARRQAVDLTDRYRAAPADDPGRAALWAEVVRQTEAARELLERWLQVAAVTRAGV